MILRRFMKHFTDQNWFAVSLDVLVVITGIFLGMQVTEWNDNRKSQLSEGVYIAEFHRDIETSIEMGVQYNQNNQTNVKSIELLAGMAAGLRSKMDDTDFHSNMASATYKLVRFRYVRKTWQELINTGRYNQFADAEMRILIDKIVEKQDFINSRTANLDIYTRDWIDPWLTEHYDMWRIHAEIRTDTKDRIDIPKSIGEIDIAAILSNRSFRNMLAYRRLFFTTNIRDYQELSADYELLQQALSAKLKTLNNNTNIEDSNVTP